MSAALPYSLMALAFAAGAWFVAVAPGESTQNVAITLLIFGALRFALDAGSIIKKAWNDSPGVFP